jgi:antitoxin (DNA-binding transcriptional repressor) of toxin-antitoxin stability system
MCNMKTATLRQVHNEFGRVLAWVEMGEEVLIRRRKDVVARILPPPRKARIVLPDFARRLKKIYPQGVKGKPVSEIIDEGRGDRS